MKLIIIGGGIAGLSAGIYARQSGIDTTIYEMHTIPGGNSTSWKRGGYFIEGGMHWLTGSGGHTPLHRLWKETGALQENNPIYNRDPFLTFMAEDGPICLYRDPDRLKEHLLSISPEDKDASLSLVKDIKALGKLSMPITDIKGVKTKYKSTPSVSMLLHLPRAMAHISRLSSLSVREYAQQFRHEGIRNLLLTVTGGDMSATAIGFTLGSLSTGDSGYPKGGSLQMARNMADTYLSLGGVLEYNRKIRQVVVKDGRACGVLSEDEYLEADAVLVASDTRKAIDTLFEQPLHEPWMEEMRQQTEPLNCVFISLGVRADLSGLPGNPIYPLKQPFLYNGIRQNTLGFNNYAGYEGYAPDGCTTLTFILTGDTYDDWKAARKNGTYAQKKQNLAESVIKQLALLVPETAGKVEMWDVATPLTYERYCGTWRGSWMSMMRPGTKGMPAQYPLCSESIQSLYFAGQRMMLPGGLPIALSTGREAVQYLCRDKNIVFQCEYEAQS